VGCEVEAPGDQRGLQSIRDEQDDLVLTGGQSSDGWVGLHAWVTLGATNRGR